MSLNFPNRTRCYDTGRRGVRFWGHDGAFEISFFVDAAALARLSHNGDGTGEASSLSAFDRFRDQILRVATKLYASKRKEFYVLVATDF